MRPALFLSALMATVLIGGTALAERSNDSDNKPTKVSSARELKERVLQERGQRHESSSKSDSMTPGTRAAALKQVTYKADKFRSHGDMYEQYGERSKSGTTSQASQAAQKIVKAKLSPGQSHGEQVDGSTRSKNAATSNRSATKAAPVYKATVDGSNQTWKAGGKNVRSYVHFTNDKGQVNNQIKGATASAMKMRHVAKTLINVGLVKVFAWETAGGDGQSCFPGN